MHLEEIWCWFWKELSWDGDLGSLTTSADGPESCDCCRSGTATEKLLL